MLDPATYHLALLTVTVWTHWIKQYLLADKVVNVSVAGSTWQDKVANQTYDGNPQPSTDGNVMGNQVQKVLNAKSNGDADYQDFDVITLRSEQLYCCAY